MLAAGGRLLLGAGRVQQRALAPALARPSQLRRGWSSTTAMAAPKDVAPAEAAALLDAGYTYLDVRTPEEFATGHAKGAVNIPLLFKGADGMVPNPDFMQAVQQRFPDTDEQLVVACKSGGRSARACAALKESYTKLAHSTGGWDGWLEAGLPVTK